ncbi:MAG: PepSY-associated TM helix domain-containing protein [Planctomyces sp.]|nr:PepSY-associated TM helix domain-containing protein [Planctomyces sp.]
MPQQVTRNPSEVPRSGRRLSNRLHALIRWLHIYSSLLGFLTVLFFSVTGITLNHPDWFGTGHESVREASGQLPEQLLPVAPSEVDSLSVVEFLRSEHQITAGVRDFQQDDDQLSIAFAGPGYSADIWVDRTSRDYQLTETRLGLVAVINDLHKGRDTGPMWSAVIDISAVILVLISLTGIILLCWLRRRWRSGLATILGGSLLFAVITWMALA